MQYEQVVPKLVLHLCNMKVRRFNLLGQHVMELKARAALLIRLPQIEVPNPTWHS